MNSQQIHPETGELSTQDDLDREKAEYHNLVVQAYDNYHFGFTTGNSRESFSQVTIQVTDVNDNAPVILSDLDESNDCVIVNEFHDLAESIHTVRAEDADDPNEGNGQVSFWIRSGDELGLFRIQNLDGSSAKIFAKKSLQGFYGNYSLLIEASDGGTPALKDTMKLNVCVQDFNNNAPKIVYPPSNFTIRVFENATVGTELTVIRATDDDIGLNGEIRYGIKDAKFDDGTFAIDPVTGQVTLAKTLDRERQKIHQLRVEATDLGRPTALKSDLDLTVFVRNVNDHKPKFAMDGFLCNFTEAKAPGLERIQLPKTIDHDDVGEDEEASEVCYFIVDGNEFGIFDLQPERHRLSLNKMIDRELTPEFNLTIRATEECHASTSALERTSFDPDDDTLLMVKVTVVDIDDNAPQFSRYHQFFST